MPDTRGGGGGETQGDGREVSILRGQGRNHLDPHSSTVVPGKNDSIWIKLAIQLQLSFLSEGANQILADGHQLSLLYG